MNIEAEALAIAADGARNLAALVSDKGRFRYRFDPTKGTVSPGYNIIRHCGVVWSMLELHRADPSATAVLDAGERAIDRLLRRYVYPYGGGDRRCVVEKDWIKLGGNALAVLALTALHRVRGNGAYLGAASDLGRYILSERRPDGDFVHKRKFKTGEVSSFRSEYFTGEALLALLTLHEATGEALWLQAAAEEEDKLAAIDYGVTFQSHWCLYALELLCRHVSKAAYLSHAEKIARHILEHRDYRVSGRSTPVACRSEGLLAFLRLCRASGWAPSGGLAEACLATVRENLLLQAAHRRPDGSFVRGGGGPTSTEVRIDYTQHNLSAFLYFHEYMAAGRP